MENGSFTHRLREDLRVVALRHLPDLFLGSLRVDDPVLPLDSVLDLLPELLFHHLMLLKQRREAGLDRLRLVIHRLVALCKLEQPLDLVLALLASRSSLLIELICICCGLRVGRGLSKSASSFSMTTPAHQALLMSSAHRLNLLL